MSGEGETFAEWAARRREARRRSPEAKKLKRDVRAALDRVLNASPDDQPLHDEDESPIGDWDRKS